MGILSGRCGGYCGCAVMVVGSNTWSTGRGMGRRSAVGFPGNSSWILSFCGSSTGIILRHLAGRQGAPVEGGVLLRFRTLHLHLPLLEFLYTIQCATVPSRHSGSSLCFPPGEERAGCGTAQHTCYQSQINTRVFKNPAVPPRLARSSQRFTWQVLA